ncbi:MAG: glycosyltransferase [Acidimicrobiales bacterium]
MKENSGWLGNAGSLVAGRLVVAALGWIATIIVARNLDQDAFGRFTFVFGMLGMMSIVTDLGLGRIALSGVMDGAGDRREFAGTYVVLRTLLGFVGYGVALLFTVIAGYPADVVTATAVGGLVVIVATASHAYELVLQAHLQLGIVAVSAVAGRLAQLGLIAAIVVADGTLVALMVPAVIAELIIAAIKIPKSLRMQPTSFVIRPTLWWALLREAVPISIGTALATLYFRVDSIMLSKLSDFSAVAVYGVAFKFVDVLHFISLSISVPLLTVLVRSWPGDKRQFKGAIDRTVMLMAFVAGALIVHFVLFASETVELLYGGAYVSGALTVQLLILGEIIGFGSVIGLTLLTAVGRHRPYPYIALAGLVVNVGLNIWAIDRYGFQGAAVTTVITEVVVVFGMWLLVLRVGELPIMNLRPILLMIPAAALAIGCGALVDSLTVWPLAAATGAVVYAVAFAAIPLSTAAIGGRGSSRPGPPGGGAARPVRVVVVGHSRSGSGAERVLLRYTDAMVDAGWEVIGACPEGFLARELRQRGIEPWIIPDLQLPGGPRPLAAVTMLIRWVRAAILLQGKVERDMVLVVNGLLALPPVRMAGLSRSALWLVHDVVVRSDLRFVAQHGARKLAGAAGVSEAAAALPRSIGVPTVVVRNGTVWPIEPARPSRSDRPVIGINAMVTEWKGHHILLDAVADLPGIDLEVLGGSFPKDAAYRERLEQRATEPDLQGRVRFLGHQEDPLEAMRSWSVAVSASVEPEAGPLAVLEAMSLGIAVVATAHGGAVEVVGSAGLLVEPRSADELRAAIQRLLGDPELRLRCSEAGRAAVAGELTEEISNRAFLKLLCEMRSDVLVP